MQKYNLLKSTASPNQDEVRQYAELLVDIGKTERHLERLERLQEQHSATLSQFVWKKGNRAVSLFDLEDTHIANILQGGFADNDSEVYDFLVDLADKRNIQWDGSTPILEAGQDF